jgi:hypothetical protein
VQCLDVLRPRMSDSLPAPRIFFWSVGGRVEEVWGRGYTNKNVAQKLQAKATHRLEITTLKRKVLHVNFLRGNFFWLQDPFRAIYYYE